MKDSISKPKITIGLPSYNGERTIKRTIDSLISQTYTNFELIISDDDSSDLTSEICEKYQISDKRIKFIINNDRKGWINNFIYLLDQAKSEYFMWAAQDDYWDPKFIEKNLEILEANSRFVGSISDIKLVGNNLQSYYSNDSQVEFIRKYIGTYEEKVQYILEFNWVANLYSIFRTEQIKKCIIRNKFAYWDFAFLLNVIRFGDLNVLDDVLMFKDTGGVTSKKSLIALLKTQKLGWFKTYFPHFPLTIWCLKNLGLKIFIKNNAYFRHQNIHSTKKIIRELIMTLRK